MWLDAFVLFCSHHIQPVSQLASPIQPAVNHHWQPAEQHPNNQLPAPQPLQALTRDCKNSTACSPEHTPCGVIATILASHYMTSHHLPHHTKCAVQVKQQADAQEAFELQCMGDERHSRWEAERAALAALHAKEQAAARKKAATALLEAQLCMQQELDRHARRHQVEAWWFALSMRCTSLHLP